MQRRNTGDAGASRGPGASGTAAPRPTARWWRSARVGRRASSAEKPREPSLGGLEVQPPRHPETRHHRTTAPPLAPAQETPRAGTRDCEDSVRSLLVLGCGAVTSVVTPRVTGFVPLTGLVRSGLPAPARPECWPDQELDRRALAAPVVSHHSPADLRPGPEPRPSRKERTHDHSDRSRGGRCRHRRRHPRAHPLRGRGRCPHRRRARRDHRRGHRRRLRRAGRRSPIEHSALRAWAIEGTGGYGAGLARHLERGEEVVIELDRPERARAATAPSPTPSTRSAPPARPFPPRWAPRAAAANEPAQALSVLLAARRSAVEAAAVAQRQLFSPGHRRPRADPGPVPRPEAAGDDHAPPPACAPTPRGDVETTTTVTVLRDLARRIAT